MSIVTMSRMRVIAPQSIRRTLLRELTRLGCVEIGTPAEYLADPQWSAIMHRQTESAESGKLLSSFQSALETLDKYAPVKSSLLSPRRQISEEIFNDKKYVNEASDAAQQLNVYAREISGTFSEESRLVAKKASLAPWASMDVPFNAEFGTQFKVLFGISPSASDPDQLAAEAADLGECTLKLISSDREQHYYLMIVHRDTLDDAMDRLKPKGFSLYNLKDVEGTAAENIAQLDGQVEEVLQQREKLIAKVADFGSKRDLLKQAIDVLTIETHRDDVLNGLTATSETVYLEGWVPSDMEKNVASVLEKHGCAYGFSQPEDEDEPPVLLDNHPLVKPYGMVTELYALPTYRSGLDPNPFMAPFFFIFFGLMMADIGYGLMISLGGYFLYKKVRPQGVLEDLTKMAIQCGISTMFWGLMFGSFFGNLIPAFTGGMLGKLIPFDPILFDPLTNPMPLFYLSLAFGAIQIFLGMGLNGYMMIKQGNLKGALFDVGFWFMLLGGFGITILNVKLGLTISALGALGVLLTAGRENKSFLKKVTGGLGSLYNVTSYMSDLLSYSRLLALSLATAVIAQVMNTMGTLGGSSFFGWILFILLFVVGHLFNLAINLLGTYVHTSRLQYIEFFGKFFESGGRKFKPLYNKTKYVEVIKEGN